MSDPWIELEAVRLARREFALEVPTWRLGRGQIVGLVGPNGSGKTTLLHLIHGIFPPDAGTVRVLGVDPWRDPVTARSGVGFASEEGHLPERARAGEWFRTLALYYPGRWDDGLLTSLCDRLGVDRGWRLGEVSRGERLRVMLVAALAFAPDVVLLDEPTTGLDLGHKQRLMDVLLEVVESGERSVVISSHSLPDVQRISDRLLVLGGGRVVGDGEVPELVGEGRTLEEAMVAWGVAG